MATALSSTRKQAHTFHVKTDRYLNGKNTATSGVFFANESIDNFS